MKGRMEVSKMRWWVRMLGILTFLAVCPSLPDLKDAPPFPFSHLWPGGWEEMAHRMDEHVDMEAVLIHPAIRVFVMWEGRYPNSFSELCGSPTCLYGVRNCSHRWMVVR